MADRQDDELASGAEARLVQSLLNVVRAQHRAHLSPEQLNQLADAVADMLAAAYRMEEYPLANGDAPAFVFTIHDEG